jgi:TonB family protein
MNPRRTRWLNVALAVAAATAFTFVVVCSMVILNYHIATAVPESGGFRCVFIDGLRSERSQPSRKEEQQPAPQQEDQIMTVNLDAAVPAAPTIEPLDLNLAIPSPAVDAVRIALREVRSAAKSSSATAAAMSRSDSTEPRDANQVDRPPREHAGNVKPPYPERERQLGIEGSVVVELLIDERGHVLDVRFTSGPEAFRRAVLEVARSWRFDPAEDRGHRVKTWGTKEVRFKHPRNRS